METIPLFAQRTKRMKENVLREILKAAASADAVSLAGGIPAPESFPVDIIAGLTEIVLKKYGTAALQYGPSEGFPPLRQAIAQFLATKGLAVSPRDILVTSGSQGALDAVGKILINKGDKVAVESPTYLGALHAFNPYEPEYLSLETDEEGPTPDSMVRLITRHHVKFIYLVPTFQNPTGRSISLGRRQEIAAIIRRYNILLLEDDPYSDLRYKGETIPSMRQFAPDYVIYLGTLSKILAPGLRVGYCIVPERVKKWMIIAKQGIDLHTSSLSQAICAEYLQGGFYEAHLPRILEIYGPRLDSMLGALNDYFPTAFSWSTPQGGMFVWAQGPPGTDMEQVGMEAVKENIYIVPGKYFHISPDKGRESMRLNFTMQNEQNIRHAIHVLSKIVRKNMADAEAGFQEVAYA